MPNANDIQHGGHHYQRKPIQPWDYIAAIHYIEKLIEVETPATEKTEQ